ncbi:hypothetical protein [Actinomadura sp. 21ATH]|uniref:hypothetical protein n=1 Tax=Actinomadura sp. 21ATH TaxID=1735444 RepID=UPI0035BFAD35
MTGTVVFVHGRGQEFRAPEELAREWLAGLNAGLTSAGLPALTPERTVLPFYGNVLYQAASRPDAGRPHLEGLPSDPDVPGPLHPYLPADAGEVERRLVADMAAALDVDDVAEPELFGWAPDRLLSWDATRRLLLRIADRTRADQEIITAHLRDVAVYLTRARDEVLDAVRRAVPESGALVLVTHSLGTVVGRDLLEDPAVRDRTGTWITVGSPLGLEAVQRNLRPPGARHPGPGVEWTSAYDVRDIVALGHPLRPIYGDPLTDVRVLNGDRPHGIERYLAHAEVAGPIGRALARG